MFYISHSNENEELAYTKNMRKIDVMAKLQSKELNVMRKKQFIYILDLSSSLNDFSEDQATNILFKYLESDTGNQGGPIDKFNEAYELLKTQEGISMLDARLLLKRALDTRIVYEKGDSYTWIRSKGNIVLGDTYTEAINFILNPKKAALVEELESTIKAKII